MLQFRLHSTMPFSTSQGYGQNSGAYIFRPNASEPIIINSKPDISMDYGHSYVSVTVTWDKWASQVGCPILKKYIKRKTFRNIVCGMEPNILTPFFRTDPLLYQNFENMIIFRSGNLYTVLVKQTRMIIKLIFLPKKSKFLLELVSRTLIFLEKNLKNK